jgi:hypothetical protein
VRDAKETTTLPPSLVLLRWWLRHRSGYTLVPRAMVIFRAYAYATTNQTLICANKCKGLCDAGDVFTIPANLEEFFDQISNAVARGRVGSFSSILLSGDHSVGTYIYILLSCVVCSARCVRVRTGGCIRRLASRKVLLFATETLEMILAFSRFSSNFV